MSDTCLRVQEIASAVSDGEASAEETAFAKAHCASCESCANFVRGLQTLRTSAIPAVPEVALDRVLESIRAEARASETAGQLPVTGEDTPGLRPAAGPTPAITFGRTRMTWAGWAAAAAAVIVAAFITVRGVAYLAAPTDEMAGSRDSVGSDLDYALEATPQSATGGTSSAPEAATKDSSRFLSTDQVAPAYIVYEGRVYLVDPSDRTLDSSVAAVGWTRTAMDGDSIADRRVYSTTTSDTVLVGVSETVARQATVVTRGYAGRRYALRSNPIESFGTWPTLPRSLPIAVGSDNTPQVVPMGVDELGTQVFASAGADPTDGFAIAPQTASLDPAAGNPNWTWWEPIP